MWRATLLHADTYEEVEADRSSIGQALAIVVVASGAAALGAWIRVAMGHPLPQGAPPWNSSMPVWQDFLSDEEIWQVVAYIYAGSGSAPRVSEEH